MLRVILKNGECLKFSENIVVKSMTEGRCELAIDAPREVKIERVGIENMVNNDENMVKEFLITSYFGEEVTDSNIFEKCIERAYKDLARAIPYRYSVSQLKKMKQDGESKAEIFVGRKNKFKEDISEEIKNLIKSGNKPEEIIGVINEIIESRYKDLWIEQKKFSYGLCQKWVNMTFKYLWLFEACTLDESELDAPIDSYIINALISTNDEGQKYALNEKVDGLNKETAWSTMDEKMYKEIQKAIDAGIEKNNLGMRKIQWEYLAWNEQANIKAQN